MEIGAPCVTSVVYYACEYSDKRNVTIRPDIRSNLKFGMTTLVPTFLAAPATCFAGGERGSNFDPYADGPTDDNEWIEERAHLMILALAAMLDTFPTDPDNGGPYVMWKVTPYAHLMVPLGSRDE
jgi:hypothetical protein